MLMPSRRSPPRTRKTGDVVELVSADRRQASGSALDRALRSPRCRVGCGRVSTVFDKPQSKSSDPAPDACRPSCVRHMSPRGLLVRAATGQKLVFACQDAKLPVEAVPSCGPALRRQQARERRWRAPPRYFSQRGRPQRGSSPTERRPTAWDARDGEDAARTIRNTGRCSSCRQSGVAHHRSNEQHRGQQQSRQ